ncbi:hypothetical protein ACP70R_019383 [Stipagrostis hirtigluma subsp. patula]
MEPVAMVAAAEAEQESDYAFAMRRHAEAVEALRAAEAAGDADAALEARVDEGVFKTMSRAASGEDVTAAPRERTRKVERLTEEQCQRIMAMPWPPAMPPHYTVERRGAIRNPKLREILDRGAASTERAHRDWARMREQYAAHGYADRIVDVDEHGEEWLPEEI